MKKDKKWIHKEVDKLRIYSNPEIPTSSDDLYGQYVSGVNSAVEEVLGLINQLDDTEVLSQDWIDKSVVHVRGLGDFLEAIAVESLLVPKKELPVVPKYVADFIKVRKHADAYSLQYIFCIAMQRSEAEQFKKEYDWISANDEAFATAWMHGYEVEEEQKYYVDLDTAAYVAKWQDDRVDIYTDGISGSDEYEFHLTEEEIKNYDERFWPFAKPVE